MQYYSAVCIVLTHQQQNLVFRQFVETFDPQLYPTVHCSQLHMTNNDLYPHCPGCSAMSDLFTFLLTKLFR